jgi:hypothetical protein
MKGVCHPPCKSYILNHIQGSLHKKKTTTLKKAFKDGDHQETMVWLCADVCFVSSLAGSLKSTR